MGLLSKEEWEALCKRCGRCCLEKYVQEDGTIVVSEEYCSHLDQESRLCKVYGRRFQVCLSCLPVTEENLAKLAWLPEDCGYVEYYRQTRGHDPRPASAKVIWPKKEKRWSNIG